MIVCSIAIHGTQDCGLVSFDTTVGWGVMELVCLAHPPSGGVLMWQCCHMLPSIGDMRWELAVFAMVHSASASTLGVPTDAAVFIALEAAPV